MKLPDSFHCGDLKFSNSTNIMTEESHNQTIWVQMAAPQLTSCIPLTMSHSLPVPWFLHPNVTMAKVPPYRIATRTN